MKRYYFRVEELPIVDANNEEEALQKALDLIKQGEQIELVVDDIDDL